MVSVPYFIKVLGQGGSGNLVRRRLGKVQSHLATAKADLKELADAGVNDVALQQNITNLEQRASNVDSSNDADHDKFDALLDVKAEAKGAAAKAAVLKKCNDAMPTANWLAGPVPNEVTALRQRVTNADGTALANRLTEYQAVTEGVDRLTDTTFKDMRSLHDEVMKAKHDLTTITGRFANPLNNTNQPLAAQIGGMGGWVSASSGGKATMVALSGVATDVRGWIQTVRDGVAREEADRANLGTVTNHAQDCLTAVNDSVTALGPGAPAEIVRTLQALQQRFVGNQNQAPADQTKLMLAIQREAAALLIQAKTAEFQAVAGKPPTARGKGRLDGVVANFQPPETNNPRDQAIVQAALAARFSMDVAVQTGMKADRLPALYALFQGLPEGHMGHAHLGKLEYGTHGDVGNYYVAATPKVKGSKGSVVLRQLPENPLPYNFVADDGTTQPAQYFEALSLHEVGHGVDARKKVMSANQGGRGFGQWREETLESAAAAYGAALAANFAPPTGNATAADLVELAKTLLKTGACAQPADGNAGTPLASLFADWNGIMADPIISVCTDARVANSPWNMGAGFAGRAHIGPQDRVYFEAYAGYWWSYVFGERAANGISTYQWRSPGEWFAEIYALHHLNGVAPPASVRRYVTA